MKHKLFLLTCCLLGWALSGLLPGLAQGQELRLMLPVGHSASVNSVSFSPDGSRILTASSDLTAKVWDAQNGALLLDLRGHTDLLTSAAFGPGGALIVTASADGTVRVWSGKDGQQLRVLSGHTGRVASARFSPDGTRVVSAGQDKMAKVWDVQTGKVLFEIRGHNAPVMSAAYSPDSLFIVTAASERAAKLWAAYDGRFLHDLHHPVENERPADALDALTFAAFSADSKHVITASRNMHAEAWSIRKGSVPMILGAGFKGHWDALTSASFSPDGVHAVTSSLDGTALIWNWSQKTRELKLDGHAGAVYSAAYSPDGSRIVTGAQNNTAQVWDAKQGTLLFELKSRTVIPLLAASSYDGTRAATIDENGVTRVWDTQQGHLLWTLKRRKINYLAVALSPDGTRLATGETGDTVRVWDTSTSRQLLALKHSQNVYALAFSPDGTRLATGCSDDKVRVWDASSGELLALLKGHHNDVLGLAFSPDGTRLASAGGRMGQILLWSAADLQAKKPQPLELRGHTDYVRALNFSPDGTRLVSASNDNTAIIWDAQRGTALKRLVGHTNYVLTAYFSVDGKRIMTSSGDKTARFWDATTGEAQPEATLKNVVRCYARPQSKYMLTLSASGAEMRSGDREIIYHFMAIDSADYLVLDRYNRYDGTAAARKALFFTCGAERVGLDQVKDQLWVPNLAERLMNSEILTSSTLDDLNVCGAAPDVQALADKRAVYRYQATVHRGGLSEMVLSVNGIVVKHYRPQQLLKTPAGYELVVSRTELLPYFASGKPNTVSVKAYTLKNTIASRGAEVVEKAASATSTARPNLYAVMIGVSDYQGTELDLKYAAKDAQDLSNALGNSARKLLNTDGHEHVYLYRLTTGKGRDQLPEKARIRQVFVDIGRQATANDIIVIFMAGHGLVAGEQKQFYFLTSEASHTAAATAVATVSVSTQELREWLQPARIRAQKRVLILDACNSGQAINDLVKIGQPGQDYLAARGTEQAQQLKAIEQLNEQAGLSVLTASASNQKAYELGQYSQGLLTYALLDALKNQPEILENNKYLNMGRWFDAASHTVRENSQGLGVRQQTQFIQTTNFNLGVVDAEVLAKIVLPRRKPLFGGSNFQNKDEAVAADDLGLNALLDQELSQQAARGSEAAITFAQGQAAADAYLLSGRYEVQGPAVIVRFDIRQGKVVISHFEASGTRDKLPQLATSVAAQAVAWAEQHK